MCQRLGSQTLATEVDHIIPHGGDQRLFWAKSNWQPLCKPHHSSKTHSEVHGYDFVLKPARPRNTGPRGADVNGRPLDPLHHWNKAGGGVGQS
jgi:5-methylcytosine-specific restriction protein A